MSQLIQKYSAQTDSHNICLGGGVALNCKMNGELLNKSFIDDIFVNPAANDAGVSLGAALELAHMKGYCSRINQEFSPYLGCEFENDEIIHLLEKAGINYFITENAESYLADCLEKNAVAALFQGRNEWGPRALGNRSIIGNSRFSGNLDHINSQIKERELGRPLSPSIIDADSQIFNDSSKTKGRYMNIAYTAQKNQNFHPSVIHKDQTYRPGFVSEEFNSIYHRQLKEIKRRLGDSVVINTSFNLKTPIIFNVQDAIELYKEKEISTLIFNNNIVVMK